MSVGLSFLICKAKGPIWTVTDLHVSQGHPICLWDTGLSPHAEQGMQGPGVTEASVGMGELG